MELRHTFTVPAGVEETWAHFNDIESVAGCFPGASVTEADEESFKGTVKVKLGPIALVYNGSGTFVEKDEAARRLVIDAKGKDKRGNGTAGAVVTATMSEAASGSTEVAVATDLSITGKAAQFGRGGVIQDVSDKLLGQFVACLEDRLSTGPAEKPAGPVVPEGTAEEPAAPASAEAAGEPEGAAPTPSEQPRESEGAATAVPDPQAPPPDGAAREQPRQREAIDLGSTVLPVLARAYWKPALAGLVVLLVIIWWATRD